MKDEEALITRTESSPSSSSSSMMLRRESSGLFGKTTGYYKFWVLAALLLLAFWSMFASSVTLKWSSSSASSSSTLTSSDDCISFPLHDDLDILELGDREKVVKRMWAVYTESKGRTKLSKFWLQAFEAAYDYLVSDRPGVRDTAISEIAKLSLGSVKLDPVLPQQSTVVKH